jgi:organic hydroperoxide reductase OsmC/OhrA
VANIRAKTFAFEGGIDADGHLLAGPHAGPLAPDDAWNPEALVLAAVTRCSLASLRYYADRAGIGVTGSGRAHGTVTAREEDGVYAFVEIQVEMDITIDPAPAAGDLTKLLRRAEAGCFVGQSLRAKPSYLWRVNGERVGAA